MNQFDDNLSPICFFLFCSQWSKPFLLHLSRSKMEKRVFGKNHSYLWGKKDARMWGWKHSWLQLHLVYEQHKINYSVSYNFIYAIIHGKSCVLLFCAPHDTSDIRVVGYLIKTNKNNTRVGSENVVQP